MDGLWNIHGDRLKRDAVDRQRSSIYIQDEIALINGSLALVPAIRQDHDTQYGNHTSKKLALRYAIDQDQAFLLSYGEGYRAPSFKELYLLFENSSVGYVVEGNDKLTPESSRSVHAQYNLRSGDRWSMSFATFHNAIKDLIENVLGEQQGGGIQSYSYENISSAETLGVDWSGQTNLGEHWSLDLNYGFLQARDLAHQVALAGRSKHSLSYQILFQYEAISLSHRLKWQSARAVHESAAFGNDKSLLTGDMSLSYRQASSWLYSIAIENIGGSAGDLYWKIPPRSLGIAITWIPKI